jgi:hypothetical protein
MRRALWETVTELVDVVAPSEAAELVRVTDLTLDVPIEVLVHQTAGGAEFLADLPRWRWRGALDERPGRLRLHCREGGPW